MIKLLYSIHRAAVARLEKFSGTIENYRKAIEFNPEYADAYQ